MFTNGVEMTTAVTDLINAVLAAGIVFRLRKLPGSIHRDLWLRAIVLFGLVSLYGVPIHGIRMSERMKSGLWIPMYLLMSVMLASFVIAVQNDLRGHERKRERMILGITALFCTVFVILQVRGLNGPAFLTFAVFGGICVVYILWMLVKQRGPSERKRWYTAAMAVFILATVLQSVKSIRFTLVWEFNYNGVYHVLLAVFLLLISCGVLQNVEKD